MDGPALWLNLLPEGSLIPTGARDVGGFAAECYAVQGEVAGGVISGEVCKEPQANALVLADLHIPAGLLDAPDAVAEGEMTIVLSAEQAEVERIELPH